MDDWNWQKMTEKLIPTKLFCLHSIHWMWSEHGWNNWDAKIKHILEQARGLYGRWETRQPLSELVACRGARPANTQPNTTNNSMAQTMNKHYSEI